MKSNIVEMLNTEIEKYNIGIIINVLKTILEKVEKEDNEMLRLMMFSKELGVQQEIWYNRYADNNIYDKLTDLYNRVTESVIL